MVKPAADRMNVVVAIGVFVVLALFWAMAIDGRMNYFRA